MSYREEAETHLRAADKLLHDKSLTDTAAQDGATYAVHVAQAHATLYVGDQLARLADDNSMWIEPGDPR